MLEKIKSWWRHKRVAARIAKLKRELEKIIPEQADLTKQADRAPPVSTQYELLMEKIQRLIKRRNEIREELDKLENNS